MATCRSVAFLGIIDVDPHVHVHVHVPAKMLDIFRKTKCNKADCLHICGRYFTRIILVIVWYGAMWSLLGNKVFPKILVRRESHCDNNDSYILEWNSSELMSNNSVLGIEWWVPYTNESYELNFGCQYILNVYRLSRNSSKSYTVSFMEFASSEVSPGILNIPEGHFFGLFILIVASALCGYLVKLFYLPPLTGMILAGCMLRNVPYIDVAADIHPLWSSTIRNIALVIVLIRGGLSLNPQQLKRLKMAVVLLSFFPCIVEGGVDGLIATFFLRIPWEWGLTLG